MGTMEFLVAHGEHDNFRLKIEASATTSWRIEPSNATCPLLVSGTSVLEDSGHLACRHTGTDIVVLEGASFGSEEGATGSARVPGSSCSEDGWSWLLDSVV